MSQPPALARAGYDLAVLRRADDAWLAAAWARSEVLVVAADGTAPVMDTATGPRLRLEPASSVPDGGLRVFLGERDGTPYFASLDLSGASDAPDGRAPGGSRAGLRAIGADLDAAGSTLLTSAIALRNWHIRHPRCPRCGTPTEVVQAGWARRCPADGSEHYPRTDPAVIVLVHDGGDRCVLGRQPAWPPGRYSILAGFVEPGESAEAAVYREVGEEVGIALTDVTYVASQPWPFPDSLMLGYTARVCGDPTLRVDHDELEDARWFSRSEIRERRGIAMLPPPVSIAYRLITDWLSES